MDRLATYVASGIQTSPIADSNVEVLANAVTDAIAEALGYPKPKVDERSFALALILFFTVSGFLYGYLMTRLFLQGALGRADRESVAMEELRKGLEEAKGAAASASHMAEASLSATTQPKEMADNLDTLVARYNEVRKNLEPGAVRTPQLDSIVIHMIPVARNESLDVAAALADKDVGKRMAGCAFLIAKPDPKFLKPLADAVAGEKTSFGQYWGLRAIKAVISASPQTPVAPDVRRQLVDLRDRLPPESDRSYELKQILDALNQR